MVDGAETSRGAAAGVDAVDFLISIPWSQGQDWNLDASGPHNSKASRWLRMHRDLVMVVFSFVQRNSEYGLSVIPR